MLRLRVRRARMHAGPAGCCVSFSRVYTHLSHPVRAPVHSFVANANAWLICIEHDPGCGRVGPGGGMPLMQRGGSVGRGLAVLCCAARRVQCKRLCPRRLAAAAGGCPQWIPGLTETQHACATQRNHSHSHSHVQLCYTENAT